MGIEEFILEREKRKGQLEGIQKGVQKGKMAAYAEKDYAFVKNLLTETDFDNHKIAHIASVDLAFVEKVKLELSK